LGFEAYRLAEPCDVNEAEAKADPAVTKEQSFLKRKIL